MDGEDKVQFSLAARITLFLEEDNEERISGEITAKGGDVKGRAGGLSVPQRREKTLGLGIRPSNATTYFCSVF